MHDILTITDIIWIVAIAILCVIGILVWHIIDWRDRQRRREDLILREVIDPRDPRDRNLPASSRAQMVVPVEFQDPASYFEGPVSPVFFRKSLKSYIRNQNMLNEALKAHHDMLRAYQMVAKQKFEMEKDLMDWEQDFQRKMQIKNLRTRVDMENIERERLEVIARQEEAKTRAEEAIAKREKLREKDLEEEINRILEELKELKQEISQPKIIKPYEQEKRKTREEKEIDMIKFTAKKYEYLLKLEKQLVSQGFSPEEARYIIQEVKRELLRRMNDEI